MNNIKSKNETFQQLMKIAENFEAAKENYLISYPHFINYFNNLQIINKENIIIGISFTYSWMPTILKSIKLDNLDDVIIILNKVKLGEMIEENELFILKKSFNNSLVGTSKLLHFINPEKYAIWDSKVFRFLYNEFPHKYKLEKPVQYLNYLDYLDSLIIDDSFPEFYKLMINNIGFEVSKFRAIELAFFKGY